MAIPQRQLKHVPVVLIDVRQTFKSPGGDRSAVEAQASLPCDRHDFMSARTVRQGNKLCLGKPASPFFPRAGPGSGTIRRRSEAPTGRQEIR
jgi:hypothetical protein